MKEIINFEMQNTTNCHSRLCGNSDSITEGLDPRIREDDRGDGSDRVEHFAFQSIQKKCGKSIGYILIIGIFLIPHLSLATGVIGQCSSNGYTIATVNGVFTNEQGAQENMLALQKVFGFDWYGQDVDFQYLLNPSHLAGLGDILMAAYQKIFDNETVEDYDLVEMLKSASEKVKTQKILLVAHSQGNFYANSFYDTVAGKKGGVPAKSIGVYSVATPASRVAGEGKWLTSDTDKVISGIVGRMPFKKIMPPNAHIELQDGDDANGHNFKDVYLKYRSAEIVANIQASLNLLSENTLQNENKPCMSPPELTIAHKLEGAVFAVADPVASAGSDTVALAGTVGAKTTVWTYKTAVAVTKNVVQTALATASSLTAATKSLMSGAGSLTRNNGVTAGIATQDLSISQVTDSALVNQSADIAAPAAIRKSVITPSTSRAGHLATVSFELIPEYESPLLPEMPAVLGTVSAKNPLPKLVFVGLRRMFGISSSPPRAPEKIETSETKEKTESIAEEELSAPVLSAPQCADSLAADGCLLATTTARFEWAPVAGASYYGINKNGEYATTTETALNIAAPDFSDYSFEVAAVGASGQKSATSAKTISIATIPIAINEIAWMGTVASPYDEWLELKNNTGHTINLSQWKIESRDGAPLIALSGSIPPREYLVLERRENTVIAEAAIATYGNGSPQWVLGNGGEELTLLYSGTTLDRTPVITGGAWAAGESSLTTRKTMERYGSKKSGADPLNWGTNLGFIQNGADTEGNNISGTPGARNSVSFLVNKGKNITENFTLTADDGSFVVPSKIRIASSSTLTVKPGVEVLFYKDFFFRADGKFYIKGTLDARGTAENPIIFSSYSANSENQNGDLWFDNAMGTSTLDNVRFENTKDVGLNNSKLEIRNTEFANTDGGVNAFNGSSVAIENTRFANLTDDAIGAYNNSVITIASTTIDGINGGDGVGAYNSSTITIASTTINNIKYYGDGIVAYNSSVITIASTTLSNLAKGDGIGAYNNSIITIASTTIRNVTDGDGIGAYDNSVITIASTALSNVDKGDGIGIYNATLAIASSSVKDISGGDGIGAYINSVINIASTTIDGVSGGDGVAVYSSTLAIASSTIENVSDDGVRLKNSTSTISNTLAQNGGANGIDVYGGTANIRDTTVSGFADGAGVSVDSPKSPVAMTGGEITGNSVGVSAEPAESVILTDVSVHDNAIP